MVLVDQIISKNQNNLKNFKEDYLKRKVQKRVIKNQTTFIKHYQN